MVRTFGIENAERKQQPGARQAPRFFLAQIALVEIERRAAVELEQHIAARAGDLAPRPELVPAAGAAMADADCRTIEADRRHHVFARRAIGANERLTKIGAVAG